MAPLRVCRASSAVDRLACETTQSLCLHMAEEELSSLCAAKGTPEEKAKCYEVCTRLQCAETPVLKPISSHQ